MDTVVFVAVLAAALMHAGWNAIVKVGLDRFSAIVLMSIAQGVIGILLIPVFPLPAPAAWPWLAAGILLHMGYKLFLIQAYAHGELSQVYPVARGTAPLIVLMVGALFLGEALGVAQTLAVLAIALGIMVMAFRRQRLDRMAPKALAFALGTACFTAGYTLVDGVGAREAGTASGYTMWLFAGDALGLTLYALVTRGPAAIRQLAPAWRGGTIAGGLSLGAYWIVIWGFTVAPLALVAALRETSVLFAMLIGVFLLGEKAGPWRWVSGALILAGVVLMRL